MRRQPSRSSQTGEHSRRGGPQDQTLPAFLPPTLPPSLFERWLIMFSDAGCRARGILPSTG